MNTNHLKIKLRFLFGLRWRRMKEWTQDILSERPGPYEMYRMTLMAGRALISPISRKQYLNRLLICEHCPIFNPVLKNCRKGELGCGCYVPYKALAQVDCWLREQDPKKGWGVADAAN